MKSTRRDAPATVHVFQLRDDPARSFHGSGGRRSARGGPPSRRVRRGQRPSRTMRANSSGSRLAPPTSAPSMSGCAISSAMFAGLDASRRTGCARVGRGVGAELLGDRRPDRRAHRLRVVGRGRAAGADRPDRLVGDHHRADLLGACGPASPARDLAEHLRLGLARLALVERLADAHDRRHPVLLDRGDLLGRPSRRSRRTARAARCGRR